MRERLDRPSLDREWTEFHGYIAANGADFCAWMKRHGYLPPKVAIEIHSANPAGIQEMLLALGLTEKQVTIDPYVPDKTEPEDLMERNPPRLREALARMVEGKAPPPPNLRVAAQHDEATENDQATPVRECGTCKMYDANASTCWGYGNIAVDDDWLCDAYAPAPDWRAQNTISDSPDPLDVLPLAAYLS